MTPLIVVELSARLLAPCAGTALALVHRLDASDRDLETFLDQIGGQRLGLGKRSAHGLALPMRAGTVWMVKSIGVTRSS